MVPEGIPGRGSPGRSSEGIPGQGIPWDDLGHLRVASAWSVASLRAASSCALSSERRVSVLAICASRRYTRAWNWFAISRVMLSILCISLRMSCSEM